ncbi:MAG: tRNA uridine-5-carboxymethylaminomethyl(34) synthesis GTPase MnmE, partial [Dehalococcoidia bacterium]|nr:tRNA uridine-5-carboxymethylaminomethyl(34) synthesis GTPase MnmE [Dehalococcoidia bacterium]
TAGIIYSKDLLESLGIERSKYAIEQADLVLMVIDASETLTQADDDVMKLIEGKESVVIANKSDLSTLADTSSFSQPVVGTSALTGAGLETLRKVMVDVVTKGKVISSENPVVSNPRHKQALASALNHVELALQGLKAQTPVELAAIDLTGAVNALGEITGESVSEELLEIIFNRFCIGK